MSLPQIILLLLVVGVVVVLFGFYFFRLRVSSQKKDEEQKVEFKDILGVVKNPNSNMDSIEDAISLLKRDFKTIKDGNNHHYEFIYYLAKHKNASSKMILDVDKFLKLNNAEHEKMIERYEKKGLDDR